jgi:phage FluMu protein Com
MALTARCGSCNKKFKANDKLAGKRVKCPQCGGTITIPVPQPAESPASMASLLDEEGIHPAPAPKPNPTQQPKTAPAAVGKCPSCSGRITAGAVLCVNCGLDLRTGKPVEIGEAAADASGGKKKNKKRRKRRRGNTPQAVMLLRGCAVSFAFAFVGTLLWWLVAIFTGYEFGIIAWIVGGLAGAGMSFGYGVEDLMAGIAAAFIAFLAIIVGKIMIFVAIVLMLIATIADGVDEDMEVIDGQFVAEQMEEGEDQFVAEEIEDEEVAPNELEDVDIPLGAMGMSAFALFFMEMFGLLDVIFLLLACYTAYQVGSGRRRFD